MAADNILVAIKVRPLIKREKDSKLSAIWKICENAIVQIDKEADPFYFDLIFDENSTTQNLFEKLAQPIVHGSLNGINGTIFAYGQTSSGKTYTMMGSETEAGVVMLTIKEIFQEIGKATDRTFFLRVGYIEIYNEKIYDLLDKDNSDIKLFEKPNGDVGVSCREKICKSEIEMFNYMQTGNKNRRIGETNMNERSSRSHTIFKIIIESSQNGENSDGAIQVSCLNLVDLAGSEKANQTGATGSRFLEGSHINRSLLSLSCVIQKLSENEGVKYINYRDSKLTRMLQASLGGNARTAIICTITPAVVEETYYTLHFALRAKTVKNKPRVNEELSDAAVMKKMQKEIVKLQNQLEIEKSKNSLITITKLQEKIIQHQTLFVSSQTIGQTADKIRRRTWCPTSSKSVNDGTNVLTSCDLRYQFTHNPTIGDYINIETRNSVINYQIDTIDADFETFIPGEEVVFNSNSISPLPSEIPIIHTPRVFKRQTLDSPFLKIEDKNFMKEYFSQETTELKEFRQLEQFFGVDQELQKQIKEQNVENNCNNRSKELEENLQKTKSFEEVENRLINVEFEFEVYKSKAKNREQELVNSLNEARKLLEIKSEKENFDVTLKLENYQKSNGIKEKDYNSIIENKADIETFQIIIDSLKRQIDKNTKENVDRNQEIVNFENAIKELRNQIVMLQFTISVLENENKELSVRVNESMYLNEQDRTITIDSTSLPDNNLILDFPLTNFSSDNDQTLVTLDQSANENIKKSLIEIKREVDFEQEISTLKDKIKELMENISKLQIEYDELSTELMDSIQENETLKGKLEKCNINIEIEKKNYEFLNQLEAKDNNSIKILNDKRIKMKLKLQEFETEIEKIKPSLIKNNIHNIKFKNLKSLTEELNLFLESSFCVQIKEEVRQSINENSLQIEKFIPTEKEESISEPEYIAELDHYKTINNELLKQISNMEVLIEKNKETNKILELEKNICEQKLSKLSLDYEKLFVQQKDVIDLEILRKKSLSDTLLIDEKNTEISQLKKEIDDKRLLIQEMEILSKPTGSECSRDEVEILQKENIGIQEKLETTQKEFQVLKEIEKKFENLSLEYNKILTHCQIDSSELKILRQKTISDEKMLNEKNIQIAQLEEKIRSDFVSIQNLEILENKCVRYSEQLKKMEHEATVSHIKYRETIQHLEENLNHANIDLKNYNETKQNLDELSVKFDNLLVQHASDLTEIKFLKAKTDSIEKLLPEKDKIIDRLNCDLGKQITSLKEINCHLEAKYEQLEMKNRHLQESNEIYLSELESFRQKTVSDEEVLDIKNKEIINLNIQISQLNQQIFDFKSNLKQLEVDNRGKINALNSTQEKLQMDFKICQQNNDQLIKEIKELQLQNDIISKRFQMAMAENKHIAEMEITMKQKQDIIEDKENALATLEEKLKELNDELNDLKAEKDKIFTNHKDMQSKLNELKLEKEQIFKDYRDSQYKYEKHLREHETNINEKTQHIDKLDKQIKAIESSQNAINIEWKHSEKKVKELQHHLNEMKSKEQSHRTSYKELQEKYQYLLIKNKDIEVALQKQQTITQSEFEQLKVDCQRLKSELKNAPSQLGNNWKGKRYSNHDENRSIIWDREVQIQTDPTSISCSCEMMNDKIKELIRSLKIKDCQINTMKMIAENDPLKLKFDDLKKECIKQNQEIHKLHQDLYKCKQEMKATVIKCESCLDQLKTVKQDQFVQTDNPNNESKPLCLTTEESAFVTKMDVTNLNQSLLKITKKYEDLKKICRLRNARIKELDTICQEKENELNRANRRVDK